MSIISKKIKKILIDQEITITELSENIGYTRGYISSVINGHMDSSRVKKNIALRLNRDFKELWRDKTIS